MRKTVDECTAEIKRLEAMKAPEFDMRHDRFHDNNKAWFFHQQAISDLYFQRRILRAKLED